LNGAVIRAVRVYELSDQDSGARWLVDRIWPRGIAKFSLALAGWARDAAPSDELRRWFGHDPRRWEEFRRRYASELDRSGESWRPLLDAASIGDVLLLYAARDAEHNNAVALRDYLLERMVPGPPDSEPARRASARGPLQLALRTSPWLSVSRSTDSRQHRDGYRAGRVQWLGRVRL
jgi:uncharacterized protein YeaO (DUF488 family)